MRRGQTIFSGRVLRGQPRPGDLVPRLHQPDRDAGALAQHRVEDFALARSLTGTGLPLPLLPAMSLHRRSRPAIRRHIQDQCHPAAKPQEPDAKRRRRNRREAARLVRPPPSRPAVADAAGDIARGERPDPYRVWLSEIMLQQTTVEAVKPYFRAFTERWPDVAALAAAEPDDIMKAWAGLGYYSRARNLKKCADIVAGEHGGRFPDTRRRSARAARDRRLHGSRDRRDRLRPAGRGGRRQCRAGDRAARGDRDAAARGEAGDPRGRRDAGAARRGRAISRRR